MEKIGLEATAQFADVVLNVISSYSVEKGTIVSDRDKSTLAINFEHTHKKAPVYYVVWTDTSTNDERAVIQVVFRFGEGMAGTRIYGEAEMSFPTSGYDIVTNVYNDIAVDSDSKPNPSFRGYWCTKEKITAHGFDEDNIPKIFLGGFTYKWYAAFDE